MTRKATKPEAAEIIVRVDLCTGVACAPKGTPRAVIEREANMQNPTGISSRWKVTRKRKVDGVTMPAPCLDDPKRAHYLLEC